MRPPDELPVNVPAEVACLTAMSKRTGGFPPAPEPLPVPVVDSHTHLDITVAEGLASVEAGLELSTAAGLRL